MMSYEVGISISNPLCLNGYSIATFTVMLLSFPATNIISSEMS